MYELICLHSCLKGYHIFHGNEFFKGPISDSVWKHSASDRERDGRRVITAGILEALYAIFPDVLVF